MRNEKRNAISIRLKFLVTERPRLKFVHITPFVISCCYRLQVVLIHMSCVQPLIPGPIGTPRFSLGFLLRKMVVCVERVVKAPNCSPCRSRDAGKDLLITQIVSLAYAALHIFKTGPPFQILISVGSARKTEFSSEPRT